LSLYEPNPSAAGSEAVAWASDSLIDGQKCPTPRGKVSGYGVMTGSLPRAGLQTYACVSDGPITPFAKIGRNVGRAAQSALKI
jgi:hypothetical protein